MKKNLLIILLVVLAAVLGWVCSYTFTHHRPDWKNATTEQIMTWMQKEYQLTPDQYTAIKKQYTEFRPAIKVQFTQLRAQRDLVKKLEADKSVKPEELAKVQADLKTSREVVRELVKDHTQKVASLMSPEQGARYLKKIEEKMKEHEQHPERESR